MGLKKQTEGDLAGYTTINIDLGLFAAYEAACAGLEYVWGGKCTNLGHIPPTWYSLEKQSNQGPDCSGYVRALLEYATACIVSQGFPDGSVAQCDWVKAKGFKPGDYSATGDGDDHIRIAFKHEGTHGDTAGHVWLTVHGHTVESYGGYGPGQQPWQVYSGIVDECFVLC